MSNFRKAKNSEADDNWFICSTGADCAGNNWSVTTDHVHASKLSAYSAGAEGDAELIARLLDMHYDGKIEALQAENERLRAALEKYADPEAWMKSAGDMGIDSGLFDRWIPFENGYELAQKALAQKGGAE